MCVSKTYPFAIQENWHYPGNSKTTTRILKSLLWCLEQENHQKRAMTLPHFTCLTIVPRFERNNRKNLTVSEGSLIISRSGVSCSVKEDAIGLKLYQNC